MIVTMPLTQLQKDIIKYSADKIGASGGIMITENPEGIFIKDDNLVKRLKDFLAWDYSTHTIFAAFLKGKIKERKYENIIQQVTEICVAIK